MYHLIVAVIPDAYDGNPITLERNRVLREYTNETLSERHAQLNKASIAKLKRFPALFAYEHANRKDARLGWITKFKHAPTPHVSATSSMSLSPPVSWERIKRGMGSRYRQLRTEPHALGPQGRRAVRRSHRERDIGRRPTACPATRWTATPLHAAARASIEAAPTVFRIPTEPRNPRLVSVMMPFGAALGSVYATIGKVCRELGLDCSRADDIFDQSEVIQDVFRSSIAPRSSSAISPAATRTSTTKPASHIPWAALSSR